MQSVMSPKTSTIKCLKAQNVVLAQKNHLTQVMLTDSVRHKLFFPSRIHWYRI